MLFSSSASVISKVESKEKGATWAKTSIESTTHGLTKSKHPHKHRHTLYRKDIVWDEWCMKAKVQWLEAVCGRNFCAVEFVEVCMFERTQAFFTGSGESGIRQYIIENDLLECIVQLPNDIFYNTGVARGFWLLPNTSAPARKRRKREDSNRQQRQTQK